ncbi:MAG: pyrroline-5-carboxylate reductase [Dehalococcoidales bacterium]|jgi:pyrroline-5-carboxylate reductase
MKIAFIGGGNMGEAILRAMLEKKLCLPAAVAVSDVSAPRREFLSERYGVFVTADNKEAIRDKEIIVLAVKPQQINDVFTHLKGALSPEQLVVSIAAGISLDVITRGLAHRRVVRAMPNTPAQIGLGISGWTAAPEVTAAQKDAARLLLSAMGTEIYFDDEKYLDMVTAVSGSGPAYLYLFAESLIDAAVDLGLSREDARSLVLQTILGAASLMVKSDKAPAELRKDVTSKGGTTERALQVFEESHLAAIVGRAVSAACARAKELGRG